MMKKLSIRNVSLTLGGTLIALAAVSTNAIAMEIAGVKLDPKTKVGASELTLNGAGIRKRVIVNVYVGALYLAEKKSNGADAVSAAGAKRIHLHMLRDIASQQFVDAMKESIKYNTPQSELDKLATSLNEFYSHAGSAGALKAGDAVNLDFTPGSGVQIAVNGKALGKPIAEPDVYKALMRIYVGDKPIDEGLKKGMLGG